jgi:hypothetical protein
MALLWDALDRLINQEYFITKYGTFPIYASDITDTGTNVSIRDDSIAIYDQGKVYVYDCDRKEAHTVSAIITWVLFPEEAVRML